LRVVEPTTASVFEQLKADPGKAGEYEAAMRMFPVR
jgi:hypothetical protein